LNETGFPGWAVPTIVGIAALVLMGVVLLANRRAHGRRRRPTFTPAPRSKAEPAAPAPDPATAPPPAAEPADSAQERAADRSAADGPDEPAPIETTPVPGEPFASLSVSSGPHVGRVFPVGDGTTLIGRSGQRLNHVELDDAAVSRQQARIIYEPGADAFTFVNESDTNPSIVNGEPGDGVELEDGATIQVGRTTLTFRRGSA